jgi:uncharacterized alkaline shock family protein YloU
VKNMSRNEMGRVRISDEAVAEIAALAALKIKGVAGMGTGSRLDALAEAFGASGPGRGVQVLMGLREVSLRLTILVEFGAEIADVAVAVQEAVAQDVEKMTGLQVVEVDVTVQGVQPGGLEKRLK